MKYEAPKAVVVDFENDYVAAVGWVPSKTAEFPVDSATKSRYESIAVSPILEEKTIYVLYKNRQASGTGEQPL